MTTKGKLIEMCVVRGMFDNQAKEVVELAIPEINKLNLDYNITWDRPASEYPEMLYPIMFITVKKVVVDWIEKNIPLAWFKPMFM